MNRHFTQTALTATIGALMLVGCSAKQPAAMLEVQAAGFQVQQNDEKIPVQNIPAQTITVTKQAYDALKLGMTEAQACKIIGGDGAVQSDNGRIKIVSWRDGTKLLGVTFRDGKLAGKTQFGL
jgi:hypothetical protein